MEKKRIMFFKQLAVIVASGIPLLHGLELLAKRSGDVRTVCLALIRRLRSGSTLAAAMAAEGNFFPRLAVTLTAAGEQSGQLTSVFTELADFYEKQRAMQQFIIKAALYPLLLLGASLVVMAFFIFYVLPMLAAVYASMQAKPGGLLAMAVAINSFCSEYLPLLLAAAFGVSAATISCLPRLKMWALHLPVVRSIYQLVLEARFCKLLSLLLNSGINITDAVAAAGGTIADKKWQRELTLFNGRLQRGMDIGLAARAASGIFSALTLELVAVGAASGCLPQMLIEAAQVAEGDVRSRLERFKEVLAPMLLLAASLITAAVVCAVIGPLFDLFTALPEYN